MDEWMERILNSYENLIKFVNMGAEMIEMNGWMDEWAAS